MKPTHNLTDEGRALIHAILEIAFTTPSSVADVFFNWSPHCDSFDIRAFSCGWHSDANPAFEANVYLLAKDADEEIIRVKERLEAYLLGLTSPEAEKAARLAKAAELRASAEHLAKQAAELEAAS